MPVLCKIACRRKAAEIVELHMKSFMARSQFPFNSKQVDAKLLFLGDLMSAVASLTR